MGHVGLWRALTHTATTATPNRGAMPSLCSHKMSACVHVLVMQVTLTMISACARNSQIRVCVQDSRKCEKPLTW